MDKKSRRAFPAVGGSFLLVIFGVLCLTVFSLLSLSTVQAGQRLADASTQAVTAYYQADCQAEELLARIRGGELPAGVRKQGQNYTYCCPISDTQTLCVEVQLSGTEYTVLRWQAVSTADWRPDEKLEVWNGENGD